MSGIAGLFFKDSRSVDPSALQGMLQKQQHRGIDLNGFWSDGSAGIAHGLLCVTPESRHEKSPLVNEAGTLALTADVRLDNRDELIAQLLPNTAPVETITDPDL